MWARLKSVFHPIVIFYFLVVYIFASFIWWAYLHLQKNDEALNNQIAIVELLSERDFGGSTNPASIATIENLKKDYGKKDLMIYGEGLVFLLLMLFGTYKIHSSFKKEIQLNRQQRNFLLSITHELKSPLAGLKISTETLVKHKLKLQPEKEKQLLDNSLKDIDRLRILVDNLLMAAKLEEEEFQLSFLRTDVKEMLSSTFAHVEAQYSDVRNLKFQVDDGLSINADNFALGTAISNLLENAIKYSGEGDTVGVKAERKEKRILISVWDSGFGIPASDKKKIFDKFYRVGNEDTRSSKGTGLGLFIVKQLVELHKGEIEVEDNKPKGTLFTISIPQAGVSSDSFQPAVKFKNA